MPRILPAKSNILFYQAENKVILLDHSRPTVTETKQLESVAPPQDIQIKLHTRKGIFALFLH